MHQIKYYPVTHGGIRRDFHPELKTDIDAQTAVRYIRFFGQVKLDKLELGLVSGEAGAEMGGSGRLIPNVPTHPAHLLISVLDKERKKWKLLKEVNLPPNPAIMGDGLTQDMQIEEMESFMQAVLWEHIPYQINMRGVETDCLRIECDREHPVWPSHGEMNGGQFHVPYTILNPLKVFGERISETNSPVYNPVLLLKEFNPIPPEGMEVLNRPDMILYKSKNLSVGFSLRRPIIMHLGWDAFELGKEMDNRVRNSLFLERLANTDGFTQPIGLSGPFLRDISGDYGANEWTGEVSVCENKISYSKLKAIEGLEIDAVFTIEQDWIEIDLEVRNRRGMPVVEFEIWRFAWDIRNAMTGAAGVPSLTPGRNGDVDLPMLWAGDSVGCLLCESKSMLQPRMQVESYRRYNLVTGGIMIGANPEPDQCLLIPKGTYNTSIRLRVTKLEPSGFSEIKQNGQGTLSRWSAPYSCFRPEYGGFSNNCISVNCHMCQVSTIETIVNTNKVEGGPDLIKLAKFSVERALLDGGGYGYHRQLFLDSDPSLISAAGKIYQTRPDKSWLLRIQPGIEAAVDRMLNSVNEDGMVVSRALTGNSGSFRWSTNLMDVIGFGHLDAYVNAMAYRAFNNASGLLFQIGSKAQADACLKAAGDIYRSYSQIFLNPETGWVAGWRSKDGLLHDYAFLWVNGTAIAYGLLNETDAHIALSNLENLRSSLIVDARLGLPLNLLPIDRKDHMLPKILGEHVRTYENYTDGSMAAIFAGYYLRALSIYGFEQQAKKLAKDLDEAFFYGMYDGGNYTAKEFHSWEGLPNGYEGTMLDSFGCLYAIGVELGYIRPSNPEWWLQSLR